MKMDENEVKVEERDGMFVVLYDGNTDSEHARLEDAEKTVARLKKDQADYNRLLQDAETFVDEAARRFGRSRETILEWLEAVWS